MIPKIVTQFLFAVLYCTMFLEVLYIIRIHSLHKQKGEPMSTVKTVYPEWVRKYREKGYSIKKSGERYYLYRHSSRRVEGKKYPQAKDTYVGVITPDGIIYAKNKLVPTGDEIRVREFGLSKTLLLACPDSWKAVVPSNWKDVLKRTIIRYVENSYLLDDSSFDHDTASVNYAVQFTTLKRKIREQYGIDAKELNILKTIFLVKAGNKRPQISYIDPEQMELLDKLGVTLEVD